MESDGSVFESLPTVVNPVNIGRKYRQWSIHSSLTYSTSLLYRNNHDKLTNQPYVDSRRFKRLDKMSSDYLYLQINRLDRNKLS